MLRPCLSTLNFKLVSERTKMTPLKIYVVIGEAMRVIPNPPFF